MGQGRAATGFWRDGRLPYVESRRACHSRACYRPHSHPTFSIGAVDAGTSRFSGAGGVSALLAPGDVVFVPAGRVHSCNPLPGQAWSYQMLHLDTHWLRALRGHYLASGWGEGEPVRVCRDPALYRRLCELNALLFGPAPPAAKEVALAGFFAASDLAPGTAIEPPPGPPRLPADLLASLQRRLCDEQVPASLAELAQLAGLGRHQLLRAFRACTGLTPHAWQQDRRVHQARAWLRGGRPLAEVAHALGFADQAHFQRVFKQHVGATPGRYRG